MNQTFEEFLTASKSQIPFTSFTLNLLSAAFLTIILGEIYVRYGNSLSNRKVFSRNFLLITMTTMLIITIVKSSLALSLGLVGALSIIRFRTAIKEPEELAFLFLAISIGLGFGADQAGITILAFFIISVIIIISKTFFIEKDQHQNLHLTINSSNPESIMTDKIIKVLKQYCLSVSLKRLDETNEMIELSFLVQFSNFDQLNKTKTALKEIKGIFNLSFLDNKGLY